MKNLRFLLAAGLLFCTSSAYAAYKIPSLPGDADGDFPIQIKGDTVEYIHEEGKAVGTGHVSIDYEGAQLSADKIVVYTATKKAVADGHVTLTQKGGTFKGEHAEYDFGKKVGQVSNMDATIAPSYFGKAKTIEQVSENHYRTTDSYVTTCCGDSPFYKIQAHQIDIYPKDKIVIRNALLLIKGVPVLFIPLFVQPYVDFDRFPVQIIPGKTSEWGVFALSKWRYTLADRPGLSSKGNVLVDFRAKKGWGEGLENFYNSDQFGRGTFRAYYAEDQNPPETTSSGRNRFQWRHQTKLNDSTTVTTEINKLSDPLVIKDFFYRDEYERNAFPDNYVSLITAKPEYTFSVLERRRIDDFYTVVERDPELRFDTHNRQFASTPFYLRAEYQFSNLHRTAGGLSAPQDLTRFDTNHTLSYAGRVGPVSVVPHVGTRQTYFSRRAEDDGDLWRGTFDPGLDLSTRFYKTYDKSVHAMGLDWNQLRHIFEPTISYNYRPNPTVSRTVLGQFDSIDAIDKQNFIRFNFENKVQTKERSGANGELVTREIARVIPFMDTDLHTGRLANVGIDAELRPWPWMGIEADASYDPVTRDYDTANADVYFNHGPWNLAFGQRYLQNESSQSTIDLRLKPNDEWEFRIYDRYEFEEGASKEFQVMVSKAFSCVIVDLIYNHREGDTFLFVLRLKAFPNMPFRVSQSYDRPKSSRAEGSTTTEPLR